MSKAAAAYQACSNAADFLGNDFIIRARQPSVLSIVNKPAGIVQVAPQDTRL
jgi:hypothetical protein